MTIRITSIVLAAALVVPALVHAQAKSADRTFVAGGKVDIHLDAGDYEVRAASDNHVRVTMTGRTGDATVDVAIAGTHADVTVRNTSHTNFTCVIEVPKVSDVAIRLSAGDLRVGDITGSKDIESTAGDVSIAVGNSAAYASVDAAVRIGDLSTGPFDGSQSGLLGHELRWTGKGKHTLRAHLGVGDLKLQ